VRLRDFEVRLAKPLATAKGEITERRGTLVAVEGREGRTGVGEATPLPGWTETVAEAREALGESVDSSPADAVEELSASPAARHGVSLALLDANARAADEPLAAHLADGEDAAKSVPVNATVGLGSPAAAAAEAEEAVGSGFTTLKLKVGGGPLAADVARVEAVEEAVGAGVSVRVDANGAWDPSDAREAVEAFADLDVEYVEQPVPGEALEALADLRGRGVEIAADEALAHYGPDRVLSAGAADVLVLKPMALGGVDRARAAAVAAAEVGVDTVVTTTIDAVVARTAAVHLAASIPDVRACGFATADMLAEDLAPDPTPVTDGAVRVPRGRGTAGDAFDGLV
jgi:o-succinylbenzoate synthase